MPTVLTTAEAVRQYGAGRVRRSIDRGLWQRPARGVVVTHNGPLGSDEAELVALVSAAFGSVLGGLSALRHDGFTGFPAVTVQIVQPMGARRTAAGVELHWSTFLDERDVHPLRQPPRTRPARSVVDAASWAENRRYARAIVIAAVQQGLVTTRQLREALTRRGACRHRALIIQSILDAHGGIQSLPERDFAQIIDDLGWTATRQAKVRGPDGRYHLDVFIAEYGLAIEVHGIPHHAVRQWDRDLLRANEIVIAGKRLLIFSSYAIRHEREAVVDQLRRFAATGKSAFVRDG